MYTLAALRQKVKRRIRQLRSTTDISLETEAGNFASDTAVRDALNRGRKQLMVDVLNAELWGSAHWVFTTSLNTEVYKLGKADENVLRVDSVHYDTTSAGVWVDGTSYEAHKVQSEEFLRKDPTNTPSATNPVYLFENSGIKIMVSTDGSMTAGKYIAVKGIRDLIDLSSADDDSNISDILDEMCMDYAVFILCESFIPQLALSAFKNYHANVAKMNQKYGGL